jgi:hypothetical protein
MSKQKPPKPGRTTIKQALKVLGHKPKHWKKFIADPKNFHVIFSHQFAIALWGHRPACNCAVHPEDRCEYWDYEAWQYHLSRMVLEDPPYLYLLEKWNKKPKTFHMRENSKR